MEPEGVETGLSRIEYTSETESKALSMAQNFLASENAREVIPEEIFDEDKNVPPNRLIRLENDSSHTAFHVERFAVFASGSAKREAQKTVISWLTLGENKGDLPGGSIEILEEAGSIKMIANKLDKPLITDWGYENGYSGGMVDHTRYLSTEGKQIQLNNEQVEEILSRLASAKVNTESTENTAALNNAENRMLEAYFRLERIKAKNPISRSFLTGGAREQLISACLKYNEIDEGIKKKKKPGNEEELKTSEDDNQ